MLICVSVVLNIGPFAKTSTLPAGAPGPTASTVTEGSNAGRAIARAEAAAAQISQLTPTPESLPEPVKTSLQAMPVSLVEVAPSSFSTIPNPVAQPDRENSEKSTIIGV